MIHFKMLPASLLIAFTAYAYSSERCSIHIQNSGGRLVPVSVETAVSSAEKEKGLMNRKSLPSDTGMLFVFEYENYQDFWMKNTYIPLSIAYIDTNGIIREIYDMKPLDTSITYPSKYPARYALEVNLGWFSRNNIRPGCRIKLNGCLGKSNTLIGR
jgi:uncharacterized protein